MKLTLRHVGHVSNAEIVGLVDHGPTAVSESTRSHLASCSACQARLDAHRDVLAILTKPWSEVRVQHASPRVRRTTSLPIGLGLVALTAVLVAALTVGSNFSRQVASSPSGPTQSPSATSPGQTLPASPSASVAAPQVLSTGSGDCPEGDTVAVRDPSASVGGLVRVPVPDQLAYVRWAPDGGHFLLAGSRVDVFDSGGVLERSTAGAEVASWIDDTTYATGSVCAGSLVGTTVTVHTISGSSRVLAGLYDPTSIMGSGHGLLALAPMGTLGQDPTTTVIWNGRSLSAPISGRPLAWSPDGSLLLVTKGELRSSGTGGQALIGVTLLSAPDMTVRTSLTTLSIDPRYDQVFSPDSRWIAFPCALQATSGLCSPMVVDSETGKATKVTDWMPASPLSWLPDGHLLVGPSPEGDHSFLEWSSSGLIPSPVGIAGWAKASPLGGVVAGSAPAEEGGTTHIDWANGATTTNLPGARDACWSPEGMRVLLDLGAGQALLLVAR